MDISLIISAFIAGLLTFLAPCTLPLIPGYLAFVSGASLRDFRDTKQSLSAQRKIFLNGLFFVLGFSTIFILFGIAAGSLGSLFASYKLQLSRIGGVFVILFGLFMLEVLHLPILHHTKRISVPPMFRRGRLRNSFLLGVVFGFGWTPCVGPILGSVLFLASSTATMGQGAFLLGVFSLGLAIPFLMLALAIGTASLWAHHVARFGKALTFIGGSFLVFLGILLLTDSFGIFSIAMYRWFDFLHYESLLEYL
ncbi:MAG: cytochrome c biogenesis protein CcdA [Candidatus Moranbacteria bacterium]|nr:cytochrome c biogenesis protein CcdA [Candidatus Moranbacteria bacterium]